MSGGGAGNVAVGHTTVEVMWVVSDRATPAANWVRERQAEPEPYSNCVLLIIEPESWFSWQTLKPEVRK